MAEKNYYIWKDRNFFCICEGTEKNLNRFLQIDYTTGQIYGVSGRAVKHIPSGFSLCLKDGGWYGDSRILRKYDNYLTKMLFKTFVLCRTDVSYGTLKDFKNYEILANAFYGQKYLVCGSYWRLHRATEIIELMDEYNVSFRELFNRLNIENNAGEGDNTEIQLTTIYSTLDAICQYKRLSKYQKHIDILGVDAVNEILNHYSLKEYFKDNESLIWNWCEHPHVRTLFALGMVTLHVFLSCMAETFKYAKILNRKLEKGSPFQQWEFIHRDYTANQNKIANDTITKFIKEDFAFEDDNFIAIIPRCIEDLTKEGAKMDNCIGGMWLTSYGNNVFEGKMARGVVFIRRKDNPEKSYVDCDFDLTNGNIYQFYRNYNRCVCDEAVLDFKEKLQQHLTKVCQA